MQAQAVHPAEFWLNDRGEPLAAPQHPRDTQGDGGINPHEVRSLYASVHLHLRELGDSEVMQMNLQD